MRNPASKIKEDEEECAEAAPADATKKGCV